MSAAVNSIDFLLFCASDESPVHSKPGCLRRGAFLIIGHINAQIFLIQRVPPLRHLVSLSAVNAIATMVLSFLYVGAPKVCQEGA